MKKYEDFYQWALLVFGILVLLGIAVFVYREVFPEYKIYQIAYKDLEVFRSSITGEPPAPFKLGIKQIVIPDEEGGPEVIDRCISCHVAVDLPHFSPTVIAVDVNDNEILDANGNPSLVENPEYVWGMLDQAIENLGDHKPKEAALFKRLKTKEIDGKKVDMTKVLAMHPLIGGERTPFEFHDLETYGCTSCHSGNGQALVAKRAHGPVFDGEYEPAYTVPKPQFTEVDLENDPKFARMYNDKPAHDLLFQTTPILTGPLIVAKCVQCHLGTEPAIRDLAQNVDIFAGRKGEQLSSIEQGIENDKKALEALLGLKVTLTEFGFDTTVELLNAKLRDYTLSSDEIDATEGQLIFLVGSGPEGALKRIEGDLIAILGSQERAEKLQQEIKPEVSFKQIVKTFLSKEQPEEQEGRSIFGKLKNYAEGKEAVKTLEYAKKPLKRASEDASLVEHLKTPIDRLISNYDRGKQLFVSQACYACHRIEGFSRASVGPELTKAGLNYPWFIKESIVWPQADLSSSTMPNFHLDHEELEDLMTFLMAQTGQTKAISEVDHKISLKAWEQGEKMPWEEPFAPSQIDNLQTGMLVYATEGCAACHKLEGYTSSVGYAGDQIKGQEWFYALFPEQLLGSEIATRVIKNADKIDQMIIPDAQKPGMIEEIESRYPGLVEGFYSNFKFAKRAHPSTEYKERVQRVLMVYIQTYGLGRDIAPHLNYSGIYRDDAWLLGHFHAPADYTARSIMPVMPFDDTKFFALNHMLHELGIQNRNKLQEIWKVEGFSPPLAYMLLCSSCHGVGRTGEGVISEWIYPIPKNLRSPLFLRNLTKEQAAYSITHGVRGTPMPPWGESVTKDQIPVLNYSEINAMVDWLYQGVSSSVYGETEEDYQKWKYIPKDADTYFEVRPNPVPGPNKEVYYIKNEFYTPENLEAGEEYFNYNCAICHGKEGTGTGLRATTMMVAKPRILTNLPWLKTRDDLRLLRSITYGVPGTAMIPWGDQTTEMQRLQLVMYIRQLTSEHVLQEDLKEALYSVFDRNQLQVTRGRINEYAALEKKKEEYHAIFDEREKLAATSPNPDPQKLGELYAKEVALSTDIKKMERVDEIYQQMISRIALEKSIYETVGDALITYGAPDRITSSFLGYTTSYPLIYALQDKKLALSFSEKKQEEGKDYMGVIIHYLEDEIEAAQRELDRLKEGRVRTDVQERINEVMEDLSKATNLKTKVVVQLADAAKLREEQLILFINLTR